ncbi:MAG: acyl carrier protein [Clostridiales bacterium]|jgi:acyl carrier protein|uniref:acyl carrier protein n=1 Tax=Bovifimicola ammoniilytica TaxID=2981720 RepID=UPI00033F6118|nr:acyl carrier protein [Bovifimicola ammoniilytica]MBD8941401.1 acyl carrier protein [Clostridiales bacterium]MCU6753941.1 acyl carrier protein [Bovifimicola ammoniilytica]CCZ04500.1 acyl carrier protein [Eubacterium sp. CAG:603]SCJ76731.1 Acyl carrier protein [uncultured Eubacterium sp.]
MFEKVKEIIASELGVEEDKITLESTFKDDLGADSLDLFQMVMSIEDEYGIEIPTEDLEKMSTVGDIVKYLEDKQS